jgi:signal transduction histidine kinase
MWAQTLLPLICLALCAAAIWLASNALRAEQSALRVMRLSARELRHVGTALHGRDNAGLAIAAAHVLSVADALHQHGAYPPPTIVDSLIDVDAMLAEAVAAAADSLRPGTRLWRLPPPSRTFLRADARALHHIIAHVLADAVRATAEQDWIEITITPTATEFVIAVRDEGAGLLLPFQAGKTPRDSRGIGLRLTLARRLMLAHAGSLDIDTTRGVGSIVSLKFPIARARAMA